MTLFGSLKTMCVLGRQESDFQSSFCMLGGQYNHDWQLCFPLLLHADGSDFRLYDFFCSGIQFYLLLSPYLCFISLLYPDLYDSRDDVLIS